MNNNNYKNNTPQQFPDMNARRIMYLNRIKQREKEQALFIKVFVSMLVIFLAAAIGLLMIIDNAHSIAESIGTDTAVGKFLSKFPNSNSYKKRAEFSLPFGPRKQNILLLGVDASENPNDLWTGTRTDTIILVNIDPKSKSVNAISVPRDSKVFLPDGQGVQKINAAHALGGVGMTIETIERTLGVKVDRYLMVHDNAVKEIVRALGGVDVYVEKPMRYNDYAGHLHINLAKGEQRLSPDEAVGYLRFRHDPLGDIGRTQRQQWFLRGLLAELQKPEVITKIPDIISITKKYVKTNMSLYELSQYAALTKHIDMDKIEIATLPGSPNKRGYISYWIIDPEKSQEVIDRLIYREKVQPDENVSMSAGLMYSENNASEAEIVRKELEAAGISVTCTGNLSKTHTQFIAHSKNVTVDYYNWLKKKSPAIKGIQFVYEPVNYYCGETDFTVLLTGK